MSGFQVEISTDTESSKAQRKRERDRLYQQRLRMNPEHRWDLIYVRSGILAQNVGRIHCTCISIGKLAVLPQHIYKTTS